MRRLLFLFFLFCVYYLPAQVGYEKIAVADAVNAIEINDSIVGPHNVAHGRGEIDFAGIKEIQEDNSIWFKFTMDRDTLLTFDLVPIDSADDYDFLIFKCTSTKTLDSIKNGKKIPERICYSQNYSKKSSTGLSEFSAANAVGAGPGPAYVPGLRVKAGETYFLMVSFGNFYLQQHDYVPKGFMLYFYNYWPKKKPIVLKNVLFETSKTVLLSSSFPELDKLVTMLKQNTMLNIEVRGHTDNVGNANANQLLSEQRAHAVVDYLISKGIDKNRLFYKGLGSTQPIASNKTEEGKKKNRRVEFAIIMK